MRKNMGDKTDSPVILLVFFASFPVFNYFPFTVIQLLKPIIYSFILKSLMQPRCKISYSWMDFKGLQTP